MYSDCKVTLSDSKAHILLHTLLVITKPNTEKMFENWKFSKFATMTAT